MSVSVIIPSFNCGQYLPFAIESALSQSYRDLEVIVVDDGSTDDTRNIVQGRFPHVLYVYQPNAGLPAARNTGIRHASGDLIAFLDADDWWHPEKLARQIPKLLERTSNVLVHSELLVVEESEGLIRPANCSRERFQGDCYDALFDCNFVLPSAVVVRRLPLVQAGCFDETFRLGCEDYDMWIRLARLGTFAFVPEPLVYYRKHENNMSSRALKMAFARVHTFEKALRSDTRWRTTVGKRKLRRKMCELYTDVACQGWYQKDYSIARLYARRALLLGPSSFMAKMYFASFLSPESIERLLRWKQRIHRIVAMRTSHVTAN